MQGDYPISAKDGGGVVWLFSACGYTELFEKNNKIFFSIFQRVRIVNIILIRKESVKLNFIYLITS
ncbi:hypothetical protein KL86DYS1_11074 [uncultured Dysgonomonas sp.]|uniref:Uncharacterized protein n=1 Tax=uncultured Dysgonomonas sp. TaxID=206096 RepID=A0A212J444_9BACT|nr:hypothetical protein KL86DYS1_11074 [uncultured Dysgonomonas sp.]